MPTSAIDCVQPAIQHTRDQLFRRFRWAQWSRLALVGILAAELHVGGCNFGNFRLPVSQPRHGGEEFLAPALPHIDPARLSQYLGLIALAVLAVVVLGFVFLYINSVFRFILFDSVVRRECSVGDSWQRWQKAGGRFFLWQLVFQISLGIFFLVLIGVPLAIAASSGALRNPLEHMGRLAGSVLLLIGVVIVFALAAAAVQVLARDFLVPIMALEGLDFADGWSRLLGLIRPEPGKYFIYLLLKFVMSIAAAVLFGIVAIIPLVVVVIPPAILVVMAKVAGLSWNVTTISLAVILGALFLAVLVYVLAFVCVPATIFFPAYALYFLAPRYPALNALLNPAPAPPAPIMPAIPESPPLPPSPEPIG